jgi:hypothetical protein
LVKDKIQHIICHNREVSEHLLGNIRKYLGNGEGRCMADDKVSFNLLTIINTHITMESMILLERRKYLQ